ncbi:hypothetical protein SEMRO_1015_G231490.1 [Seminavis robusta]|uniref:Uncharacterized protein n=1 Tax=Seminavis robusta TaxID=568900 RepID=A0A9N8EFS9_9STRA|nr:hypothetical protein SEMRO_1015_G231490.1 [Seminavis robusta]|eukprot:Sro1015_g231490.1 n/a (168) ;mRNA; r:5331-5834
MAETLQMLKDHFIPPAPEPTPAPSKGVMKFSVTSKSLTKNSSIADVTTKFFVDNYPAGFALDKESDLWKDLGKDQHKKLCNQFAAIKCAVRMMLMHADSFPLNPDKCSIESMAKLAEEKIQNDFGFTKTETITVYKVQKHSKTKQLQVTLKFPASTTELVRNYFKNE